MSGRIPHVVIGDAEELAAEGHVRDLQSGRLPREDVVSNIAEDLRRAATRGTWEDGDDEWTMRIHAAHPGRSGAHDEYETAMRMVGNRRSKGELVALVTWLLTRVRPE